MWPWIRTHLTLNRILLGLLAIAVVMSAIAYYIVFYAGGNYLVNSPLPTSSITMGNATDTASSTDNGSSTASSTLASSTSLFGAGNGSTSLASYSSTYITPPISWKEGYDTIAVTGAALSGSQLTLTLDVKMGATAECVPLNLRLVADEKGDLQAPLTPGFAFGENGTCIGTPDTDYPDQQVVFTVDPASLPLSFTTGGTSNEYFELSTTPSGGIIVTPPPTSG